MKVFEPKDIRNIALVGHKACGKTSIAEAALWSVKVTPRLGSTAAGTSVLDYEDEEHKRVMSTSTSVAAFEWNKSKINLLDTPGDSNFLKDSRMALEAVDGAICVVSAKDGVEPMTDRVYGWTRALGMSRAFFISKMDAENADFQGTVLDIKSTLESGCTAVQIPIGEGSEFKGVIDLLANKAYLFEDGDEGKVTEADVPADLADQAEEARNLLIEDIAANDESLMEKFFEEVLTPEDIVVGLAQSMAAGQIVPIFCGSGTLNRGVGLLLDRIVASFPSPVAAPERSGSLNDEPATRAATLEAPPTCLCFKTIVDQHAGKISVLRVLSGTIKGDTTLKNANRGQSSERMSALNTLVGKKLTHVDAATVGDIIAVAKLKDVHTGDTLSADGFRANVVQLPPPLIARAVEIGDHGAEDKLSVALQRIVEEDPGLSLSKDAQSGQLLMLGTGQQHIEIAVEKMERKFGIAAKLELPRIPYLETFTAPVKNIEGKHKKQSGGSGQFGVVYLDFEPAPRGAGLVFEDAVVGGSVPRQFIPSVEKGIRRAMERGIVAGYPVVDIKVRLFDGKHHPVDSKDVAFQMAASKAFKAAAGSARPALLEPIMQIEITVPEANMGDVMADINTRRGRVSGSEPSGKNVVIKAQIPMAEVQQYEATLRSMTHGRGTFVLEPSHMEPVPPHVQEKLVKESGFVAAEDDE